MAAVLAATLDSTVRRELSYALGESTFWSDSMIVLNYIRNEDRRFKTFVANRIAKIRSVSKPEQWRHVGSKDNPADEGSRGTYFMSRWLNGPEFLIKDPSHWPTSKFDDVDMSTDPEVKRSLVIHQITTNQVSDNLEEDLIANLVGKCSRWTRLVRILGWILRFRNSIKDRVQKRPTVTSNLLVSEIKESENMILSWEQRRSFPNWQQDSRLKTLRPVLLGNLLRVEGRLNNSQINFEAKHPVILPHRGNVARLLIEQYHEGAGHSGWSATLNTLRERYWIMKGKSAVKGLLKDCVTCRKHHARPVQQLMASLPEERVTADKPPFTFTGLDFGPIEVKQGRSKVKRYGCIFTCLVTRAVHLEVADSADTDSFINAYRRFVARRGDPKRIFSDNGTNFVAGERELREALAKMNQSLMEETLHTRGCEWIFNPCLLYTSRCV
ncbi:uncharacterized protein LOC117100962 [Anneissia japonica]|uniref:uncharacterized protein LOC117100962 n=1 Tax=Anneissia japonica TaxID=1529436 RepID=UPI001425874C|nr:uncharacterized protein LOC117100962 [Anneissia japonica]